jgi:hypothetical protein
MSLGTAAVLATYLMAVHGAENAPPAFRFTVQRDASSLQCPDGDALAARVATRLTTSPAQRTESPGQAEVVIVREGVGFLATISAPGMQGGSRQLVDDNPDCTGLAEALVLMLAMIADGHDGHESPSVDPPVPPRPATWQWGAGMLASTALGTATAGIVVDGAWQPGRHWSAGLSALWLPEREITFEGKVGVSVMAAALRTCWAFLPAGARVVPSVCGILGAGTLRGAADGYQDSRTVLRLWLVAGPLADVGVRISGRWSLALQGGRLFSLRDQQFTVRDLGTVFQSGDSWLATAGVRVRIP